ncbi:MAG: 2-amino-4-hydroxy-6-hydroxymethyldihydropteridine diphosphokinase [Nitrospiraceae bacterium]|nr:2-amino-4-hydroxy-6-hydroxymethyldihydropteridine diphosphokinase [Nitrospiraceae bacterium]
MQACKRAYIGLGANMGKRRENLSKALDLLSIDRNIEFLRCSGCYETEPVDIETSQWFINAVAEIDTVRSPEDLVCELLEVEKALGRDRSLGIDRPIDLDLLYMEGVFIRESDSGIQVPHPRIPGRRFVLLPWSELAPDLVLRPWNKTVSELLKRLPAGGPVVRRLKRRA